jgi:hypothetical protein
MGPAWDRESPKARFKSAPSYRMRRVIHPSFRDLKRPTRLNMQ